MIYQLSKGLDMNSYYSQRIWNSNYKTSTIKKICLTLSSAYITLKIASYILKGITYKCSIKYFKHSRKT